MGMYTCLRCKVIIKKQYRKEVKMLSENNYDWELSSLDFIKSFSYKDRSEFIPGIATDSMPDSWLNEDEEPTDGFALNYSEKTGLLSFQCSLKSLSTVEIFIEDVLENLVQDIIHLETLCEEDECSAVYLYDLCNNTIYQDPKRSVWYKGIPPKDYKIEDSTMYITNLEKIKQMDLPNFTEFLEQVLNDNNDSYMTLGCHDCMYNSESDETPEECVGCDFLGGIGEWLNKEYKGFPPIEHNIKKKRRIKKED